MQRFGLVARRGVLGGYFCRPSAQSQQQQQQHHDSSVPSWSPPSSTSRTASTRGTSTPIVAMPVTVSPARLMLLLRQRSASSLHLSNCRQYSSSSQRISSVRKGVRSASTAAVGSLGGSSCGLAAEEQRGALMAKVMRNSRGRGRCGASCPSSHQGRHSPPSGVTNSHRPTQQEQQQSLLSPLPSAVDADWAATPSEGAAKRFHTTAAADNDNAGGVYRRSGRTGSDEGSMFPRHSSSSSYSSKPFMASDTTTTTTTTGYAASPVAAAFFNAYLRDRSIPFTSQEATTAAAAMMAAAGEGEYDIDNNTGDDSGSGSGMRVWIDSSPTAAAATTGSSSSSSSGGGGESSSAVGGRGNGARSYAVTHDGDDNGSGQRQQQQQQPLSENTTATSTSTTSPTLVLLSSLRESVSQRIKRQNLRQVQRSFLQQYAIVKDIEGELTRIFFSLAPLPAQPNYSSSSSSQHDHSRRGGGGDRADSQENQQIEGNDDEDDNDGDSGDNLSRAMSNTRSSRENVIYSLDALLFERVGQLQRSLQQLTAAHYAVAAAMPVRCQTPRRGQVQHDKSKRNNNGSSNSNLPSSSSLVLLRFLQRLSIILAVLQQLPFRSAFFLTPPQAEGYAAQSGARRAAQQAISALLTTQGSTLLSQTPPPRPPSPSHMTMMKTQRRQGSASASAAGPSVTHGGDSNRSNNNSDSTDTSSRKSTTSNTASLESRDRLCRVTELFEAALCLPYEESPEIAFPARAFYTGNDSGDSNGNISNRDDAIATMKAEEWCVRYFTYALIPSSSLSSSDGGVGGGLAVISLHRRIAVVRACMAAQDEQMFVRLTAPSRLTSTSSSSPSSSSSSGHNRSGNNNSNITGAASSSSSSSSFSFYFPHSVKSAHTATSSLNASGGKAMTRVPFGVGKEFVLATIHDVMAALVALRETEKVNQKKNRNANNSDDSDDSDDAFMYRRLGSIARARDVAALCSAILFFDVHSQDALRLLAAAAPLCAAEAELLTGHDVASLLLCYATLRFDGYFQSPTSTTASTARTTAEAPSMRNGKSSSSSSRSSSHDDGRATPTPAAAITVENLYVVLGTRAGQLGDSLRVEDVVAVLQALDMMSATIDATSLTAALESSLRMRRLHKRTQYDSL